MQTALIVVDIQNDFLPGGALAVPDGNQVIDVANRLIDRYELVVATQDWHPKDHMSFAANHPGRDVGETIEFGNREQVLWPVHCVQESEGAAFASNLRTDRVHRIFRKGTDRNVDSYSGFLDNDGKTETGLGDFLQDAGVTTVVIVGLAADYCVLFTALDARTKYGLSTIVVPEGTRAVNVQPDDGNAAFNTMREAGIALTSLSDL